MISSRSKRYPAPSPALQQLFEMALSIVFLPTDLLQVMGCDSQAPHCCFDGSAKRLSSELSVAPGQGYCSICPLFLSRLQIRISRSKKHPGACCKKSDVLKIGRFARSYDSRIGRFKSALNGCKKSDVLETSDSVYWGLLQKNRTFTFNVPKIGSTGLTINI